MKTTAIPHQDEIKTELQEDTLIVEQDFHGETVRFFINGVSNVRRLIAALERIADELERDGFEV